MVSERDADRASAGEVDELRRAFRRYAELDHGDLSPLNRRLAGVVAEDDELLRVARASPKPHAAPAHLAVAVHDLLLSGRAHEAARFFPSITPAPDRGDPGDALADLVRTEASALATRMRERPLQTNEVGRAACLLPALAVVFERGRRQPLALIEIGASAGLLLRLDRYRVEYLPAGPIWGPEASRVRLRCELRSGSGSGSRALTLPEALAIATRVGVDLHPIDLADAEACRWLRAQVMPEHLERAERLTAALSEARADPPPVVKGDAVSLLPELLAAVPGDATPCILSSHVLYQMEESARDRLDGIVAEASALRDRPIAWVRMEQEAGGCVLALRWTHGDATVETTLGRCDPFGRWLEWAG